jgi:hypothetical protein
MSRIRTTVIALDKLKPNSWNPNVMNDAMYRKELASIKKFGYVNPMLVRDLGAWYEIIDGEHRWKALKQLAYSEAEVTVIEGLTDEEAKQLTIVLNETRGTADPEKLGSLLGDLLRNVPKADLLDVLPFDPIAFDRLAGLDTFDWGTLADKGGDGDTDHARWVERTYRLPKDAALVIDEAIEKAKDGEEYPDWQALEYVAAEYISATPTPQPMVRASRAAR